VKTDNDEPIRSRLGRRLRDARVASGLSQGALGMSAGIDAGNAASRISKYEQAVHTPDINTAMQMGKVLNLPAAYFYCADDTLADVISAFHRADRSTKVTVREVLGLRKSGK
jgi:transcriptional regulator with XRE-family HTH domain